MAEIGGFRKDDHRLQSPPLLPTMLSLSPTTPAKVKPKNSFLVLSFGIFMLLLS